MKIRIPTLLLTLMSVLTGGAHLRAQGHTFTYQGRFAENGVPNTGSAEFQASGGSQLAAHSCPANCRTCCACSCANPAT